MSVEAQMHLIGILLGWIIAAGYLWLVMNYFVKILNRDIAARLPADSASRRRFAAFTRAVVKSHVYIPLFLATVVALHFLMELIHAGFFVTGVIVLSLLAIQILLGLYGAYVKNRNTGGWLTAHRAIAGALFLAIAAHVTAAVILHP